MNEPSGSPLFVDLKEVQPVTLGSRLRTYFLTGLVVAGPLAITAYLTWSFVTWVDGLVKPFLFSAQSPLPLWPFEVPGLGLIVALFGLTLLALMRRPRPSARLAWCNIRHRACGAWSSYQPRPRAEWRKPWINHKTIFPAFFLARPIPPPAFIFISSGRR